MCNFFSFVVAKTGDIFYFNEEERKFNHKHLMGNSDSHAFICKFYQIDEDKVNKYEYNGTLTEDNIVFKVTKTLQAKIDYFVKNLNLKKLVYDGNSAYNYCRYIDDDEEIRRTYIRNMASALNYCVYVKDRTELHRFFNDIACVEYCIRVKRPYSKTKERVTNSGIFDLYRYYEARGLLVKFYAFEDKIYKLIKNKETDEKFLYNYCIYIKDRPSLRKYIKNPDLISKLGKNEK